ncbi:MAG: hypothetical protein JWM59_3463 [Verrucomicrobiales bacterium]|nr:hypothetical protein [Verrucomicrobiales bacterium]
MKMNNTVTTEKQVPARVAEPRGPVHQDLTTAAFRQLESVPPDLLFAASGLDLYFSLAQELNAWGDGLALTEQIRLEHHLDIHPRTKIRRRRRFGDIISNDTPHQK